MDDCPLFADNWDMTLHRFWRITLLLALAVAAAAQEFDSFAVSTEMVAMRDGVKLATDLYRPARSGQPVSGRFPVLLVRSPYNKAGARRDGEYLARHGYVVLAQDCRGRFASQGDFYAFVNEGKDGYDAIEWAAAQPWSNGKVGTFGGSYLAWDQYHLTYARRQPRRTAGGHETGLGNPEFVGKNDGFKTSAVFPPEPRAVT